MTDQGGPASLDEGARPLRPAAEGMGEGFSLLDPDFRILQCSTIAQPCGTALHGRTFWEAFPGAEDGEIGLVCKRAMAERAPAALERRLAGPGGAARWLELRVYPVPDGLAVFWRDGAGPHPEEEAGRRDNDDFLHQALAAAGAGAWMTHLETGRLIADARAMTLHGFAPDAPITHEDALAGIHPEDRGAIEAALQRALREGALMHTEQRAQLPDGSLRWVGSRARARGDGWIVGLVQDITGQKQAEAALRASEARYRKLFDSIDQGFCVVEVICDDAGAPVDYRFIETNAAFTQQTGLAIDVRGHTVRNLLPSLEQFWIDTYGRVARTGEPERFEAESQIMERYYEVFAFPVDAPAQRRVGILFNDISKRKKEEAHRAILLAEVNHRAKNLLTVVQAIANGTAGAQNEDFIRRLNERLSALARNQSLLVSGEWRGVALHALIRTHLAPFCDLQGDRLALAGPTLVLTAAAAQSLGLAVHELATNAVKYGALSTPGGRIAVRWRVAAGKGGERHLTLCWREMGGPTIVDASRRGFGAKLITDVVAMDLRGQVSLRLPPSGLVWTLRCPAAHMQPCAPAPDPMAAPLPVRAPETVRRNHARRVLIVEDEALIALQLREAIAEAGFAVAGPFASAAEALEAIARTPIAAAVLDVNLGRETSAAIARALREASIPFVVVSGYDVEQLAPDLRGAPLVGKPLQIERLLAELARVSFT